METKEEVTENGEKRQPATKKREKQKGRVSPARKSGTQRGTKPAIRTSNENEQGRA